MRIGNLKQQGVERVLHTRYLSPKALLAVLQSVSKQLQVQGKEGLWCFLPPVLNNSLNMMKYPQQLDIIMPVMIVIENLYRQNHDLVICCSGASTKYV